AWKGGVKCIYYFPPSSWRKTLRKPATLQKCGCSVITPFPWSRDNLAACGIRALYPGHPLVDLAKPSLGREEYLRKYSLSEGSVGFLAGSRPFEINSLLPVYFGAIRLLRQRFPRLEYVFAATPERAAYIEGRLRAEFGEPAAAGIRVAVDDTYNVMAHSRLLCSCSGTATLEAAIMGTPMVILYKGNAAMRLEYALRRSHVPEYIGLPNIVLDRGVCAELLSDAATPEALAAEAGRLLSDEAALEEMRRSLGGVKSILGPEGSLDRAADCFLELIR
ncbi:MAG: hypothetical protein IJT95_00280, partial [Abditibacteriota bacterium]|nr:hypothetical protein [Abditibacteriota bacterium]